MNSLSRITEVIKTKKFWSEFVLMTVAMFIAAAAVYYFLVPSKLIIGSISGLSIVLSKLFTNAGINIGIPLMVFVINAILLVIAYFLIGKEFGLKTVYTALVLGPFMKIWEKVFPVENIIRDGCTSVMGDPWFDLLCFVLILSMSQSILFRINASTGGLDIIAKIFNKYLKFDIGLSVTVSGAIICLSAFLINPFYLVVIGLIGTWINGLCVDYFTASLNRKKRVCLISKDHELIRKYIIETLQRGCSQYDIRGGYDGTPKVEIETLLTNNEFSSLMNYISVNNIKAFITASNVSELYGEWNRKQRKHHID